MTKTTKTPAGGEERTPESEAAPALIQESGDCELIDFNLLPLADDDTDEIAFPKYAKRTGRIVCSVSTDGQVTIHRTGSVGLVLTAGETDEVYEFLRHTEEIWSAVL